MKRSKYEIEPWKSAPDHEFVPWEVFEDGTTMDDVCAFQLDAENRCLKSRWAHEDEEE